MLLYPVITSFYTPIRCTRLFLLAPNFFFFHPLYFIKLHCTLIYYRTSSRHIFHLLILVTVLLHSRIGPVMYTPSLMYHYLCYPILFCSVLLYLITFFSITLHSILSYFILYCIVLHSSLAHCQK